MILTSVWHEDCGAIEALVQDYDAMTACGITCGLLWWCECGAQIDERAQAERYPGVAVLPGDVCAHLGTLGHGWACMNWPGWREAAGA
jgi:hypothetical protein